MDIADEIDTQDVVTISDVRLDVNKYVFHHVQITEAGYHELDHYRLRLDACCRCWFIFPAHLSVPSNTDRGIGIKICRVDDIFLLDDLSGHWLSCTSCWQCSLNMESLMYSILFLHLSASLIWIFLWTFFFKNGSPNAITISSQTAGYRWICAYLMPWHLQTNCGLVHL